MSAGPRAAILVMEPQSVWPGQTLDWAPHVSLVVLSSDRGALRTLVRVRRVAADAAARARTIECTVVSFADRSSAASSRRRSALMRGLGELLLEIGCARLVLAAHHVERLELVELMELRDAVSWRAPGTLRVELSFRRSGIASRRGARA